MDKKTKQFADELSSRNLLSGLKKLPNGKKYHFPSENPFKVGHSKLSMCGIKLVDKSNTWMLSGTITEWLWSPDIEHYCEACLKKSRQSFEKNGNWKYNEKNQYALV